MIIVDIILYNVEYDHIAVTLAETLNSQYLGTWFNHNKINKHTMFPLHISVSREKNVSIFFTTQQPHSLLGVHNFNSIDFKAIKLWRGFLGGYLVSIQDSQPFVPLRASLETSLFSVPFRNAS